MNNNDNHDDNYVKKMSMKYKLSEDSINKANELAKAIEILAKNVGEDVKFSLINNEIESTPEDIIELSKQTPHIQRSIIKMINNGRIQNLKEGIDGFIMINHQDKDEEQ